MSADHNTSVNEYIILVRSRGLDARSKEPLINFLASLPIKSKFNFCSIGKVIEFLFEERSVKVNDANLKRAIEHITRIKLNR